MKRIGGITALITVATSLALGQMPDGQDKTSHEKAGIEQTLMQMEHDWTEAELKRDVATIDKILADDWSSQGPTGVSTKAEALANFKFGKVESMTLGDVKVRVFGDTAVVTASDHEKSSYKGTDTSGHYTWTDVYVKRQGRWQAVASQATQMTQP